MNKPLSRCLAVSLLSLPIGSALAQPDMPSKVNIAFNRYNTYEELAAHLKAIAAAYPDLASLQSIGKTGEGRDMWVCTITGPKNGPGTGKPAMWIDGNVHGNEIQAGEAVLYTAWYLTKAYGHNDDLTKLLDNYTFYLLPSQNPDGRDYWFRGPNTPSSSRSNLRKEDDDRDGLFDEDPPNDLDGDGSITQMWKADPDGRWVRDRDDPRVFTRVDDDKKGEWTPLGSEGIDDDGDGRINEDGPGGDDMNRNWPSGWQPDYVQGGAGEFPFSDPEPRAIGMFILDHPNIAAVQSFHNAGGMILRGPGAQFRESYYPPQDVRVYDEIQRIGEQILPYYRAMVIYRDLYTVHGGFVNWTAEGLGIFSFTNELWNDEKYFQRAPGEGQDERQRMWVFRDKLQFGQAFKNFTEYNHPQYGAVLIGGLNRWSSRTTPTFMLEEECHRNFAFTMYHASQMPMLSFGRTEVAAEGPGLWRVTTEVRNENLIPSRAGVARMKNMGTPDLLIAEVSGGGTVVSAGTMNSWLDRQFDEDRTEPARLQVRGGIPGRGSVIFRYIVAAPEGSTLKLTYLAEKARTIEASVNLK
ncbi:MAG: peptidase M14 [Phycisphaerales bacterium]|nr:peptidase M14 [Phycisphaerales bacterium]